MSRAFVIAAICLCALLMQSIGRLHGFVHPQERHEPAVLAMPSASAEAGREATAPVPPARSRLHELFAGHDAGSALCTVFDQLSHADLLPGLPTLALAFAAPSHPCAVHAAWHHATQARGFLARAPPVIG